MASLCYYVNTVVSKKATTCPRSGQQNALTQCGAHIHSPSSVGCLELPGRAGTIHIGEECTLGGSQRSGLSLAALLSSPPILHGDSTFGKSLLAFQSQTDRAFRHQACFHHRSHNMHSGASVPSIILRFFLHCLLHKVPFSSLLCPSWFPIFLEALCSRRMPEGNGAGDSEIVSWQGLK